VTADFEAACRVRTPSVRDGGRQRARIVEAMVALLGERGFAEISVARVIARAGVSRRTFYEVFDGLESCFVAILDDGLERSRALILRAFATEDCWRDGLRAGLAALLMFLDSEPQLGRIWMVDALAAGSWALERRERNMATLRSAIVSWWAEPAPAEGLPPLAAEGVMASVFGVIHTHLVNREAEPLISLLGPLMGIVTGPYLDAHAVSREIERANELSCEIRAGGLMVRSRAGARGGELPAVLRNPKAARARLCVLYLIDHPEANNRQIAAAIGVSTKGQMSKLLAGLADCGLLMKDSHGPGKRNAWRLTAQGYGAAMQLRHLSGDRSPG
jgi:AcrR family transcriptional regulator